MCPMVRARLCVPRVRRHRHQQRPQTNAVHANKAHLAKPANPAAMATLAHPDRTAIPAHRDKMPNRTKNYYQHQSSVRARQMLAHLDRRDRRDLMDRQATPAPRDKMDHWDRQAKQAHLASLANREIQDQKDHRENLACCVPAKLRHLAKPAMLADRAITVNQARPVHPARMATMAHPANLATRDNQGSRAAMANRASRAMPATMDQAGHAIDAHRHVWPPDISNVYCSHVVSS